jgi:polyisoprenoid-binding protein YceI
MFTREEVAMTQHRPASTALPPPGRYKVDPAASTIHYSGKHMFGTGTVHATFAIREGELNIADPVTSSTAAVTVDAASFTSKSAKRDRDVRSAGLLDVATYPDITFTADRLHEADGAWVVAGTVTAHGHTIPVEVIVDRMTQEGSGVRVHGRAEHLDRTALGITGSKGMVGRYLDLDLDALAVPVEHH